jgi:ribosomal protein L37AE/L43A
MIDRADYEEQLREPAKQTAMCPYCKGDNTDVLHGNYWVCFECQATFTVAQSVMASDDSIPF